MRATLAPPPGKQLRAPSLSTSSSRSGCVGVDGNASGDAEEGSRDGQRAQRLGGRRVEWAEVLRILGLIDAAGERRKHKGKKGKRSADARTGHEEKRSGGERETHQKPGTAVRHAKNALPATEAELCSTATRRKEEATKEENGRDQDGRAADTTTGSESLAVHCATLLCACVSLG